MSQMQYSHENHCKKRVEIDYCPNCHGVWLDEGELKKIIEKVGEYYSDKKNYEAARTGASKLQIFAGSGRGYDY